MAREKAGSDYGILKKLWKIIKRSVYGEVVRARRILLRLGFTDKRSSLLKLRWFRVNPWKRLGICYLHESLWGNWKRHVLYLGAKYGESFRDKVNKSLSRIKWYPTQKKKAEQNIYYKIR